MTHLTEPPLRAEQFGRRYRRSRPWAVRELSLDIPEGSITAMVGPNGSGKTTFIRACLGFEPPNEGRVLVYGHDPQRARSRAVAAIGYVPQQSALYRSLTIGDHFVMARAARRNFDREVARGRIIDAGLGEVDAARDPGKPCRSQAIQEGWSVGFHLAATSIGGSNVGSQCDPWANRPG